MTRIMPMRNRPTIRMPSGTRARIRMSVAPGARIAQNEAESAEESALAAAASAAAAEASEDGVAASAAAAAVSAAAALVSENNAETAETNAETAQGAAETAQTAAELAETNAETAATTATTQAGIATTQAGLAATAATNAQTAETNAETAETNAETAQAAAEVAQAAAEAAAASVDLPIIAPGDAGKVLTVNVTEDGYDLEEPSAGLADGDYGDFTVSGGGSAATIDAGAITYAKMQDISATSRVLGRKTAGAGDPEELTFTEVLDLVGSPAEGDILFRGASAWSRLAKGTAGQLLRQNAALTAPEWAKGREVLTADRTYYVRTDGSDSNTGLVDSSGGAFLTIQNAINVARAVDFAVYTVTIQIGSGTFAENIDIGPVVGGSTTPFKIYGAGYSSTTIGAGSGNTVRVRGGATINLGGVAFASGGAINVFADDRSYIILDQPVNFLGATSRLFDAVRNASIQIDTTCYLSGNVPRVFYARQTGAIYLGTSTFETTTAIAVSSEFATATQGAMIARTGVVTFTITAGAVTGKRYAGTNLSLIDTVGSGASFFPGTIAGTVDANGSYYT